MKRPVAALSEDDVKIAILVDVAQADAGGSLAFRFQQQFALENARLGRDGGEGDEK